MKQWPVDGELGQKVVGALKQSPWFKNLDETAVGKITDLATLTAFDPGEQVVRAGEESDSFFLLLKGDVSIEALRANGDSVELGRAQPPFSFGEVGLLLNKPRTASVSAITTAWVLSFDAATFTKMFDEIQGFRDNVTRGLASRLDNVSELVLPIHSSKDGFPDRSTFSMLPVSFIKQQKVIVLRSDGNVLTVGFVEDPTPPKLAGVRQQVPGMDIRPVRISADFLSSVLNQRLDVDETQIGIPISVARQAFEIKPIPDKLKGLVERMAAEGASDLHLNAGRKPAWRIDGDIRIIEDASTIDRDEVHELLSPLMEPHHLEEFELHQDADFGFTAQGLGRFRINIYQSQRGMNAAIRQIPWRIQTIDQLGLPQVLKKLTLQPSGLILVTGPTGSGKSTTMAAMIDHINRTKRCHILTIEDPIEFVHEDAQSIIDQREVGAHTESFRRGLRAAQREDPDVVLLGEIRDATEASLALEIANTGHLTLASVHTNSVVTTVERILEMFPPDAKSHARSSLADNLRGVICQTLVKARTGGRVAAIEILVSNAAAANLIREGKTVQLANTMQVGSKNGCQLLNDHLAQLVRERKILKDEALSKTIDAHDLNLRLQRENPAG